jgi:hypothetical protein
MRPGWCAARCVAAVSIAIVIASTATACHRTTVPLPPLGVATVGDTTNLAARGA